MKKKYLITGGCGFLGSNIAARLLATPASTEVAVFDNLSRKGSMANLEWLRRQGALQHIHGDIRNANDVTRAIAAFAPEVIFHLAGQVAMTTSLDNPRLDFEINVGGSFNVLEAVRHHAPKAAVIYSSTNKVYGDLESLRYTEDATRYRLADLPSGVPETLTLDFHSPYGCSKGAADQYMLDYARMFGLDTAVFRHSSMYGGRQFATYDQGWIGWFCEKVLEQAASKAAPAFTISGNGKQVRDVLHADDMVDLYLAAADLIADVRGQAFNIGGGMANSLSIQELLRFLGEELGVEPRYERLPVRESDQKVFVADLDKAKRLLRWQPKVGWQAGLRKMLEWVKSHGQG